MTLSDLGDLGDFLGGIGVIVTLVYLAVQVRRNTQEVRSASLDAVAVSHLGFHQAVWGDAEINKLWFDGMFGKPLAEEEGRRFLFMVISCARHWERAYHKARGGTLDATSWSGIHHELADVFSYPGTQAYWQRIHFMFPPDFVSFVEKAVREIKRARPAT